MFPRLQIIFSQIPHSLLSLFVLLFMGTGLYFGYQYIFVWNQGSLILKLNTTAKITLTSQFDTQYELLCEESCRIDSIPSMKYFLLLEKKDYKVEKSEFFLERGQEKKLTFILEKQIKLKEVSEITSRKDKILQARMKLFLEEKDLLFGTWKNYVYFGRNTKQDTYILRASAPQKERIMVHLPGVHTLSGILDHQSNILILNTLTGLFLLTLDTNYISFYEISEPIIKIKSSFKKTGYFLSSKTNTFYVEKNNTHVLEKIMYNDFLFLDNGDVLGLVRSNDKKKKELLHVSERKKALLFKETLRNGHMSRKFLFEAPEDTQFLELIAGSVFLIRANGKRFKVQNF